MTSADVLLSDGGLAEIRPLEAADSAGVHELHERASDDALRLRFFSGGRRAARLYVDRVLDSPETIALVALSGDRLVALATAEPIDATSCEVAFLVADDLAGHGLGTLLLEHLAARARDRGIGRFTALVLAENHRMLDVFARAGFTVARTTEVGECELDLDIAVTPAVQEAADLREFVAEARSLRPLLAPRSVAVYGARRDGTGIGAAVLTAVRRDGFAGDVVAIHPRARVVAGVPARDSLADGTPVDLAVIAVPVAGVLDALEDAIAGGARSAVVVSSGFGEMGPDGSRLQRELGRTARRHGVRVVGPNCLGVLDNAPDVRLNATFGLRAPGPGGLAVASQSGGVGIALMELLADEGVGVRTFVSLGNKVDVSGNDLLAAWYDDPEVTCAALYLESFGNARKFARFARLFSERKPLVAVVGGRSAGGRRAGASHTAAAATSAVGVAALCAQSGVIACRDAEELADTVTVLTREPLPAGPRIAVLSNAGGLGVLAADAAQDAGLDVVAFSPALRAEVAHRVAQTTGSANPVDAGAGADAERVAALADVMLASDEVDALLVVLVATDTNDVLGVLDALADVRRRHPGRPVIAVGLGVDADGTHAGVTTLRSSAAAVAALGRAVRYAAWRRDVVPPAPAPDPVRARKSRDEAIDLLARGGVDGWVAPGDAAALLHRYGLKSAGVVTTAADAPQAAAQMGFPVAVKVASADVVHRTERRLVATGLMSPKEVALAADDIERRMGRACPVLVQPMVTGVEMALGMVRDPVLGPLVMVAPGGVSTDLADDRAFLLPPFVPGEIMRALRTLRTWPLLDGFRGAPRADVEAFARAASALGQLAVEVPEIAELDLNPVLVTEDGIHLVDVKVRLAAGESLDEPRQLRRT
ncbi:bifunctional acetate--CoA ligase family protein/GNAT family N-acetyltransferase [Nocardioides nitrophenolicus]|uniref:bifunctional acetate--CoA ligase family protein/GNAT family N-acetyltransferase n=1 Tax=Nocardioides nitrophenolicus TaxID=60489 RepID=UPI00195BDF90|nr:bifunctional GNAT family N-acetyltransferase/acetate--CoA ligase family protein [Nocardioides nitrophenolicus]MBM7515669.1 acyl-CoA synthetase (NDP forming)/GNAT superfamily N-acetyltransferase [Nocardioides nitrophenolicus]